MNLPRTIIAISGRSASGKSTLAAAACKDPMFRESVSVTTREPRAGEAYGRDYYFVDDILFDQKQANGELLAVGHQAGKRYAIDRAELRKIMDLGQVAVCVVDPSGVADLQVHCQEHGERFLSVQVECSEAVSVQRSLDRFVEDLSVREGANEASRQTVVDRYYRRLIKALGEEGGWEAALPCGVSLPAQSAPKDTQESLALLKAVVQEKGLVEELMANAPSRVDEKVLAAASAQVNDRRARRVFRILETIRVLGEPYPDPVEIAEVVLDLADPKPDMGEINLSVQQGAGAAFGQALTCGGQLTVRQGLYRLCTADRFHPIEMVAGSSGSGVIASMPEDMAKLIGMRTEPMGKTVAHSIWNEGRIGLIREMALRGWDVDTAVNPAGQTLLHAAVRQQDTASIKILVQLGAHVTAIDRDGESVIDHARRWCCENILNRALAGETPGQRGLEL